VPWPRRSSHRSDSKPPHPKVKVHTTWLGRQYVDPDELMRHPDVKAAIERLGRALETVVVEGQSGTPTDPKPGREKPDGS